jgi:hypothetical protein
MGNSTCRPSDFPNQDAMPFAVHQRKLLSAIIEKATFPTKTFKTSGLYRLEIKNDGLQGAQT